MSTVFMFPGQGSQSIGMMADLLGKFDEAVKVFEEASEAIDIDLLDIARNGPENRINQTEITQPIVMTGSLAMWRVWQSQTDIRPDYVCGHSLGEYTALVASEVISLADAVSLVHLRGKLMQQAVPEGEGAMAALMGLDEDSVMAVCEEVAEGDVVAAANFNAPGQVVISGSVDALERAVNLAKERGARRATMLPISVPCHCVMLKPAGDELASAIQALDFKAPKLPIMQNVNAELVDQVDVLTPNLLAHLYSPVKWTQSIQKLAELGATKFVECGPGKVLTGLNKRIDKSLETLFMNDSQSLENVLSSFND